MGLVDLWGIADLHCRKFKSTRWLKYKLRAMLEGHEFEQTNGRSGFSFPLRFAGGRLEFVMQVFGDSPKFSSSGLAITKTTYQYSMTAGGMTPQQYVLKFSQSFIVGC